MNSPLEFPFVYNARTLSAPQSGVQRYARELDRRFGEKVDRARPTSRAQGPYGHAWEQSILPARARGKLLFSPANTGPLLHRRQVVTIHDASTFDWPDAFRGPFGRWYRWLLPRLARRVEGVITVSEFSRQRLIATTGVSPDRIKVVHNGITAPPTLATMGQIEGVRRSFDLPHRFFLFVGNDDPRKNVARLLAAFGASEMKDISLVLAGGKNRRLFGETRTERVSDRVSFLGSVDDATLEVLYTLAEGFVFPSLYEGFGLPPLEAMARGCPVLCSDATCLPEVCGPDLGDGGACLYFSATEVSSISEALKKFASFGPEVRHRMVALGRQQARKFSWDTCATQTLKVLREFDSRGHSQPRKRKGTRAAGFAREPVVYPAAEDVGLSVRNAGAAPRKVAPSEITLVHHWMEFFRGGEAVLEQFALLFPEAPVTMLVHNEQNLPPTIRRHPLQASFLQKIGFLKKHFRKLLPFFPEVIRTLKLPPTTRLVLSSDASVIKGVPMGEGVVHVCYCHSPPRYLWGLEEAYLASSSHSNRLGRMVFNAAMPRLREFDRRSAERVDRFIANSKCVQERIRRCYGRESVVIHPPVSLERFNPDRPRDDFYLIVSALVPYKFVNIAVDACVRLKRRLVVIGTGPEEADLKRRADQNVEFLGWQSNTVVQDHYERCRAFLFPGIEDFGITPCEAQASGAPVIAFGEGGALETVQDGVSGIFFHEQTCDCLADAILRFEAMKPLDPQACRQNVLHLGPERFRAEIRRYLNAEYGHLFRDYRWMDETSVRAGKGKLIARA